MLKFLEEGNNSVIRLSQQTSKVQCMYLAFKNLKINRKRRHQSSES